MKFHSSNAQRKSKILLSRPPQSERGFALVVTLTLMILLSILALGMLSLSVVELRTTSRTNDSAIARANAMLALQIAIGDLQTTAGLDQRITASGGITGETAKQQMITGVWKSNRLGPDSGPSDFGSSTKSAQFVKWLVSGQDRTKLEDQDFAKTSPGTGKDVVDLVSAANLDDAKLAVTAQKVKIKKGSTKDASGAYAYAVLDEGQKARVNLGTLSPPGNFAGATTALGAGQRPSLASISGIGSISIEDVDLDNPAGRSLVTKMVSIPTAELAYGSTRGKMVRKIHDFTATSVGVLADVANGGLKKDLNLLAEMKSTGGLPSEYAGRNIYEQSFGKTVVSDPSWERALAWGGIFNDSNFRTLSVAGARVPTLIASAPPGWNAGIGRSSNGGSVASATLSLREPPGPVLLPAIAKIQLSFALAARDVYRYNKGDSRLGANAAGINTQLHSPWGDRFQQDVSKSGSPKFDSPYDYLLHMVFSPIVTLHNPYNVPINFEKLRVEFVNVPFAFQVFRNDEPQQKSLVPFARMYIGNVSGGATKRFGLTLSDTLLPGEVKVYSPDIPADRSWLGEQQASKKVFWDPNNRNDADGRSGGTATDTSLAEGIAGWNGVSVGYDLDFLAPGDYKVSNRLKVEGTTATIDRWDGIPLKNGDRIYVKSAPIPDPAMEKKFSVEMTLQSGVNSKSRSTVLIFEYDNQNDVQDVLMTGNPQAESDKTIRAPKGSDYWTTEELFDHASVPLKSITNTRPFALFSAYAKTTAGGDSSGEEGLWASKPFSFQNHASVAISQNLKKGHPSHYSHELGLTRFPEQGVGIQGGSNRGKFITGHSTFRGRHFGTLFDVPLAPMQSLVSLNSAQLAAGTKLPHFTAPVGNSYAHPLLPSSSVRASGAAGYEYVDHSFLLNAALFDTYYMSGLQSHASASLDGDGKTRSDLVSEFIATGVPGPSLPSPLADPHLRAFIPDGLTSSEAVDVLNGTEGYRSASSMQMVKGAFNVNSVSVAAWKAVLSSMSGEDAMLLVAPVTTSNSSSLSKQNLTKTSDDEGGRFSRFRLPGGQADRRDPDGFWRGPIDLSKSQIQELAELIVEQVRLRGPFLSMGEFVNRQLGSVDEKSLKGALQAAIDKSGINSGVSSAAAAGIQIGASQTSNLQMPNATALVGDSAQGAPGYLMQADLLAVLANTATVRSDTFTIRAYGETLDSNGNVTAYAYCEAVVQRTPEYIDGKDKASVLPANLTSDANKEFGRRFQVVSLRWLSPDEV